MKSEHKLVDKAWGSEEWIVNNDLYCGKILRINPGFMCSMHYHKVKTETFYIATGRVALEIFPLSQWNFAGVKEIRGIITHPLDAGESWTISPYTPHRFRSLDPAGSIVIEFSTKHDDADVVRLTDSGPLA